MGMSIKTKAKKNPLMEVRPLHNEDLGQKLELNPKEHDIRSISSTTIGEQVDVKVSKDRCLSGGNYVQWNNIKNCAQRQGWWSL